MNSTKENSEYERKQELQCAMIKRELNEHLSVLSSTIQPRVQFPKEVYFQLKRSKNIFKNIGNPPQKRYSIDNAKVFFFIFYKNNLPINLLGPILVQLHC